MKNIQAFPIKIMALLIFSTIMMTSCLKDDCTEQRVFVQYDPVYKQPAEFRVDIVTESPKEMENTGKIYFYKDYIFINEQYEGVHVIDNTNPENPVNTRFINIPGNLDISIKDDIMYADNFVDLITIDVTNLDDPKILCRDEEVFQTYQWFDERGYFVYNEVTENSTIVECSDPHFNDNFWRDNENIFWALEDAAIGNTVTPSGNVEANTGQGGSLARFSVIGEYLYVLNQRELIPYQLMNNKPVRQEPVYVTWNIETLFPYKNYLFIGASNGMYIYDRSNPAVPTYVSEFRHANACDPVFVKDDIAYVTLRNGTICDNFINQLDVIDVSNISDPKLIKSYNMEHPHGLSVRDNTLYLCEGSYGLKVFKTDDLEDIDGNRIDHKKNIDAKDAISLSKEHLLVIGSDGLYQFNTSNNSDLEEISYLSVTKN